MKLKYIFLFSAALLMGPTTVRVRVPSGISRRTTTATT